MQVLGVGYWSRLVGLAESPYWHGWRINTPDYSILVRRVIRLNPELAAQGDFFIQIEPNLRVHRPGEKTVPWHTDAEFGHLPEEVNVWVPLTECTDDTQRLWVENDRGEPFPVIVHLGEAFCFSGATTRHGVQTNRTDTTRCSFDFRLLAKKDYRDTGAVSVRYEVPLRLGDYWREL